MKGSNYLNWFRRLLVLGAVVAVGVLAATAGARPDPPQHVTVPAWLSKIHYPGNSVPVPPLSNRRVAVPPWLARIHVAPLAAADGQKPVDPLAVSYLIGRGLSPSQVVSWTSGSCSQQNKPDSCYAALEPKPVDPLAVSYLIGRGLSPSEVASWTTGTCSQESRPDSCYAAFAAAPAASTQVSRNVGFQWADAGIGAGFALGIIILLAGAGAGFLISRQSQRRQTAHA
jgi:hypothetical protein